MFYPMEENESEEREQEQLLMVICPIPMYNSSPGYPRDHRLLLIETHKRPCKGQLIPPALLSPQTREHSQPAHTKHLPFRLLMLHILPLLLPHQMLESCILVCLETEMLSYRTSLVVQLGQEKNHTLTLVGHTSLGIEEISATVLARPCCAV